jgi:hypothetical protein
LLEGIAFRDGEPVQGDQPVQQKLLSVAQQVAANNRRWWRNGGKLLNSVLTIACFDRLGLSCLS